MGWFETMLSETKEIVQLQGRLEERIGSVADRIDSHDDDIKFILQKINDHGERLVSLERGEEVIKERIILRVERLLDQRCPSNTQSGDYLPPKKE